MDLLHKIKNALGFSQEEISETDQLLHWINTPYGPATRFRLDQPWNDPIRVSVKQEPTKVSRPKCLVTDEFYIRVDTVTSVSVNGSDVVLTLSSGEVPLVKCADEVEAHKTKDQIVKYIFGDRLYVGKDARALAELGA